MNVTRRSILYCIFGLALFILIAQNHINPSLPVAHEVGETEQRPVPIPTPPPRPTEENGSSWTSGVVGTTSPPDSQSQKATVSSKAPSNKNIVHSNESIAVSSITPSQTKSSKKTDPANQPPSDTKKSNDSETSSSSSSSSMVSAAKFRHDLALCEDVHETAPYLTDCDLTNHKRGIPVLWIGNSRTRGAYSWDILSNLANTIHNNASTITGNTADHPQGFVEAFGAKSISEMRGLNEHLNEPGHCWIARVMCKLQHDNIDTKKKDKSTKSGEEPIRSAIFGTLWNPYLGAMKHKKTRPAMKWLAQYPSIKVIYKRRNFFDMALDEYTELFPESADVLPLSQANSLFWNYWRQDDLLREILKPVEYLSVDYENLFFTAESTEWQRLYDYVTENTKAQLTMQEIYEHAASWPRLPPPRNETISNYAQVVDWIRTKPKYIKYIQPIPRVEPPPVNWDTIDCVGSIKKLHFCNLTDTAWGIPVVLLGFGRSGSSVTWDVLARMTSHPHRGQKGVEATGSGQTGALGQLQQYPHEHGKCWLERIMCTLQHRNRQRVDKGQGLSAVYGTKWKSSLRVFSHRKSREVLEWLAANPHIKVIHNTRNLLDVAISRHKHNLHGKELSSHCLNETCAQHVTVTRINMTMESVLGSLKTLDHGRAYVTRQLDAFKVRRVDVKYEKLYYAPLADEWMRIFRFVGAGPTSNLTMADVEKHMYFIATHPPLRNESLGNYDEIAEALVGTDWEKFLTPVWEEALQ